MTHDRFLGSAGMVKSMGTGRTSVATRAYREGSQSHLVMGVWFLTWVIKTCCVIVAQICVHAPER